MSSAPPERQETIGERLRRLRVERGLSQRRLSEPGVSYAYISRIEAGARTPSVKAIRMLARKLGVSPEYLETGADIAPRDELELRVSDAELRLRLGNDAEAAERELDELQRQAETAGNGELAARAAIALGLAAARRGRHHEAVRRLGQAVESGLASPLLHPRVYTALGDCYRYLGRTDDAASLLEEALREVRAEAPDDQPLEIRFATKLSEALQDAGDFEAARRVLEEAGRGRGAPDPYSRIRLLWSRARLAAVEGKPGRALALIRQAIVLLETTEDTLQLARAHLLSSEILLFDRRWDAAGPHLEAAERLIQLGADQRDVGSLRAQQALHAARRGDSEVALELGRGAVEALAEDQTDQATAWLALAVAHAGRGELAEADSAFRTAVAQLAEGNLHREASEVAREWSALLKEAGRLEDALDAAERAAELAASARAGRTRARR